MGISVTLLQLLLKVLVKLFDLFFVRDRGSPFSALDFMPPPGWCPAITDPYSSKLESKDVVLVSLSKVSPAKSQKYTRNNRHEVWQLLIKEDLK